MISPQKGLSRDLSDFQKKKGFLSLKEGEKALNRILQACLEKEKVILFGDGDLDGVAAVVILKEALEILENGPFLVYFPDRTREGYGLSLKALSHLEKQAPSLLILLDCGISNVKEVFLASQLGFEVIIIDHHEPLAEKPKARIIVDPKQKGDKSSFEDLSAASLVYYLVKDLLFAGQKSFRPEELLELAMIATLFDQMPLTPRNQEIIQSGLMTLFQTKRPGLKAVMGLSGPPKNFLQEVREKIIPCLVAGRVKDHQHQTFSLLTESSEKKAKKMAELLWRQSQARRKGLKAILLELDNRVSPKTNFIFEHSPDWPQALLGSIASRICQKYQKSTFICHKGKLLVQGSVRASGDQDGLKALKACQQWLEHFGGHTMAAGFSLKSKNLTGLKECLSEYFHTP